MQAMHGCWYKYLAKDIFGHNAIASKTPPPTSFLIVFVFVYIMSMLCNCYCSAIHRRRPGRVVVRSGNWLHSDYNHGYASGQARGQETMHTSLYEKVCTPLALHNFLAQCIAHSACNLIWQEHTGSTGLNDPHSMQLSLIHIWRCRRSTLCRSRWSPYH